eukprot:8198878-Pyramimonas_sp.AAC.1
MKTCSLGGTRARSGSDYACTRLLGEVRRPVFPKSGIADGVEPEVSRDVPCAVGGNARDEAILLESP